MSIQPLPKALIDALAGQFPPLYSQEHTPDPTVLAHFSSPANGWEWYLWEGSPVDENGYYDTKLEKVDFLCFGLVCGFEDEVGYVSLAELLSVAGKVERDVNFQPQKRSAVRAEREQRRNAPRTKEGLTPAAQAKRARYLEKVEADFDELLMQHQRIAREQALAWAEKVGWNIVADMVLGPDLATVWVDELNEARSLRVLPVLDAVLVVLTSFPPLGNFPLDPLVGGRGRTHRRRRPRAAPYYGLSQDECLLHESARYYCPGIGLRGLASRYLTCSLPCVTARSH